MGGLYTSIIFSGDEVIKLKGYNLTITVLKKLVEKTDILIEKEYYSSRSEFFKDAARRVLERRVRVVE